jgi:PAS domain-containing protein
VRRSPQITEIYRDIFRDRLTVELMSRNDRAVRETLSQLRGRWPERFAYAVAADPALRRITKQIDEGIGRVELSAVPGWSKVELRRGDELRTVELASGEPQTLELASGCWDATFFRENGGTLPLPLFVHPALTVRFRFAPPENLEPGYGYVPENDTMSFDGTVEVSGAFQISATEVSIGEYLRFWRSLPPEKRRKYRAVLNAGDEPRFLWDENGKLHSPQSAYLPVTGITGEAAREYCRHLSEKLGKKVSLPREWQWRRAARGADGRKYPWGDEYKPGTGIFAGSGRAPAPTSVYFGDVSPYGRVNMAGNVREFALPSAGDGDLVLVLGGSYQLPPRHAAIDAVQFRQWSDRGDDIGFRCVIE